MIKFKKPSREITRIFIHCSASDFYEDDDVEKVRALHTLKTKVKWADKDIKGFGWSDIGYHYFINKSGEIFEGRSIERDPAAQKGYNKNSLAICLSGNKDFKDAQFNSLNSFVRQIEACYQNTIPIYGHRDVDPKKTCPNFEVKNIIGLNDNNLLKEKQEVKKMKGFWKKTLSTVAPTIATALGGPLAGTAVKQLSKQFLGKENATEEELAHAIENASPQDLAKIKEIEANFKVEMQKLDVELAEVNAKDRDSARQRHALLKDKTPAILSFLMVAGFFSLLIFLLFNEIPIRNEQLIYLALGCIIGKVGSIYDFFFGSSDGSRKKDIKEVMAK
jgi:hypothetical protein